MFGSGANILSWLAARRRPPCPPLLFSAPGRSCFRPSRIVAMSGCPSAHCGSMALRRCSTPPLFLAGCRRGWIPIAARVLRCRRYHRSPSEPCGCSRRMKMRRPSGARLRCSDLHCFLSNRQWGHNIRSGLPDIVLCLVWCLRRPGWRATKSQSAIECS